MKRCPVRHPHDGWRCVFEENHLGNHADLKTVDVTVYESDDGGEIASAVMGKFIPNLGRRQISPADKSFIANEAVKKFVDRVRSGSWPADSDEPVQEVFEMAGFIEKSCERGGDHCYGCPMWRGECTAGCHS
ncbi:hypothetical protein DRQ25_05275 [Candidatus Fermentibacteria bacterium]|nr:MAG: hypothetical protein DRQ25_05275 [Candidatus Fermentibacteria bacterium]